MRTTLIILITASAFLYSCTNDNQVSTDMTSQSQQTSHINVIDSNNSQSSSNIDSLKNESKNENSSNNASSFNEAEEIYSKYKHVLILANKNNSLSPDFVPQDLVRPDIPFTFKEDHPWRYLEKEAAEAIEELVNEAMKEEIILYGRSAYRSYDIQAMTYYANVEKYGEEKANTFSAKPGESEHQTGLAIDVTSPSVNFRLTEKLGETKEGKWLEENAHRFGFIIRYLKGKEDITQYMYEPWHLRYVGREPAKIIFENNWTLEEFYEEYLKIDIDTQIRNSDSIKSDETN